MTAQAYLEPWTTMGRVIEMSNVDCPDSDAYNRNDLHTKSFALYTTSYCTYTDQYCKYVNEK